MGVVSCGTTMLDQGVFENIGAVTWDTTVKTSGFTAVSGNGYFCNTTSAAFTVTLPASPSAGDIVGIKDYANTADTNNITIGRNSSNIQGEASDFIISTEGRSVLLVYVDATKGWLVTSASQANDISNPLFITATGGTITTSGDYKIHTFTSPGTFCVSQIGNGPTNPAGGPTTTDYLVVAGGGGGGGASNDTVAAGAGGAGGYRESSGVASGCYSVSPLGACVSALSVTATGYPIAVGGGGTGGGCTTGIAPTPGSNSIFSSITSAGGGSGISRKDSPTAPGVIQPAEAGGSGGAGTWSYPGAAGNTPPVSPPQGNNGGTSSGPPIQSGGGGGGATAVGGTAPSNGGVGGAGATSSINGTPTTRAGGGGGGGGYINGSTVTSGGAGGSGGGGVGGNAVPNACHDGGSGSTNTGGGGGGGGGKNASPGSANTLGGTGGSGVVIIRYKFQ